MTDQPKPVYLDELEAIARATRTQPGDWFGADSLAEYATQFRAHEAAFMAAANPSAVLSLIAEVRACRAKPSVDVPLMLTERDDAHDEIRRLNAELAKLCVDPSPAVDALLEDCTRLRARVGGGMGGTGRIESANRLDRIEAFIRAVAKGGK